VLFQLKGAAMQVPRSSPPHHFCPRVQEPSPLSPEEQAVREYQHEIEEEQKSSKRTFACITDENQSQQKIEGEDEGDLKKMRLDNLLSSEHDVETPSIWDFTSTIFDIVKDRVPFKAKTVLEVFQQENYPLATKLLNHSIFAGFTNNMLYFDPLKGENKIVGSLQGDSEYCGFDLHGAFLAAAQKDRVQVFKISEEKQDIELIKSFNDIKDVRVVKISDDWLVQGTNHGYIRLYKLDSFERSFTLDTIGTIYRSAQPVTALDIIDEQVLLSGADDGYLSAWDFSRDDRPERLIYSCRWLFSSKVTAIKGLSSFHVLGGNQTGNVKFFDLRRKKEVCSTLLNKQEIKGIAAFDLTTVCVASLSGQLLIYDLRKNLLSDAKTLIEEDSTGIQSLDVNTKNVVYSLKSGKIRYIEL